VDGAVGSDGEKSGDALGRDPGSSGRLAASFPGVLCYTPKGIFSHTAM
jgi:hypothetical protein